MIQTHGEIAPRVIYVPERDAYADEQRSNGVNQREIPLTLLVPIRGQPQSHDLHQETGPNYRDVFGSSSSHRQSRRCVPFTFSTFQPLLSIFNETSRFAPRYFERVDLSFLDAYNHPLSHELLPANCRLCPLPTAAALFMIREGIHSPLQATIHAGRELAFISRSSYAPKDGEGESLLSNFRGDRKFFEFEFVRFLEE